jgi:hypothetical protein
MSRHLGDRDYIPAYLDPTDNQVENIEIAHCPVPHPSSLFMERHESTCWTVIGDAADGDRDAHGLFAQRHEPDVRTYLKARWHGSERLQNLDNAAQEVFFECFLAGVARW